MQRGVFYASKWEGGQETRGVAHESPQEGRRLSVTAQKLSLHHCAKGATGSPDVALNLAWPSGPESTEDEDKHRAARESLSPAL